MDPLSDVLRAVRLNRAFFYVFEGIAAVVDLGRAGARAGATGAARGRASDGLPHRDGGQLLDRLRGRPAGRAAPRVTPSSSPTGTPIWPRPSGGRGGRRRYNHAPSRPLERIRLGAGPGSRADLVCGFLGCDARPYNPLLAALPRSMNGARDRDRLAGGVPPPGRGRGVAEPGGRRHHAHPDGRAHVRRGGAALHARSCRPSRPAGSPDSAIRWWQPRWPSSTRGRRIPGRSPSWRARWRPRVRC